SFWMFQNVALTGDLEEAERLFRLLLRRAGPLGLFAEESDPSTGDHLGNYPLGLSHAALSNTAAMFERLRRRGTDGETGRRVDGWAGRRMGGWADGRMGGWAELNLSSTCPPVYASARLPVYPSTRPPVYPSTRPTP